LIVSEKNNDVIGLNNIVYEPSLFFKSVHFSTMYPYGFRKIRHPYFQRERYITFDNDFVDLDFVYKGSTNCAILLHGLEGSSSSQYIKAITQSLAETDIDICAMNHRSCSGELNLNTTMYHSGFTEDLHMIIEKLKSKYNKILLIGYSLGGNVILKYLGNHGQVSSVVAAAAISSQVELTSSSAMLNHWKNKAYVIQFLSTLKNKAYAKERQHPGCINVKNIRRLTSLYAYDNEVTARLHNFKSANDYYEKASSKSQLHFIKTPTLLVNAQNDSFLAKECFPYEEAKHHQYFHLLAPKYGGHVGFGQWNHGEYWIDRVIKEWIVKHL
jgi:predicted alpha/beta-fold hydrolase